jgi:co-chaperonin GroES (HSP10)
MIIKPQRNNIYVVLDGFLEYKGNVFIPDRHSEQTRIGTVIAIGDKVTRYAPGDRIVMSYYTGTVLHLMQLDMRDERHRMMSEEEGLGTVIGYPIPETMKINPDWFNEAGNKLLREEVEELVKLHNPEE